VRALDQIVEQGGGNRSLHHLSRRFTASIHQCFEHAVRTILVKFDVDLGPKFVG